MKKNRLIRFLIELFGWLFLICMFAGIWIDKYRWNLIFTALFSILISIILKGGLNEMEKKK